MLRPLGLALAIPVALALGAVEAGRDGLALFEPVVTVDEAGRALLRAREAVVSVRSDRDGYVSVSAIVRVNTSPDRFAAWARDLDQQKGRYVQAIGRFSQPPQPGDLDRLTFEDEDVEDLARCRPRRCAVKLSAPDILELSRVQGRDRKARVQEALRRSLVRRAADYLEGGDAAALPYAGNKPVSPATVFDSLFRRMEFLPRHLPCLADYVRQFPHAHDPHVTDSFVYWSKETFGVKPIVSLTHLTIARLETDGMPQVVIVAKQVFANHYKNGAITVTAMTGTEGDRYLVYVQQAHLDGLEGFFGGFVRRMIERRVKSELPRAMLALRDRLEGRPAGSTPPGDQEP